MQIPLQGIRVHLAGSIPDNATEQQAKLIALFVERFAQAILRDGGTLLHGSHPSFIGPLKARRGPFVSAEGSRDALILVRSQKFTISAEQLREIEAQRQYATVQIVPSAFGDINRGLVPMREWMAEHCDVVVAIGGRHWDVNKNLAGVTDELDEALARGKPGFVLGGFGGAITGYLQENNTVFSDSGMDSPIDENRVIAGSDDARVPRQADHIPNTTFAALPRKRAKWSFISHSRAGRRRTSRNLHCCCTCQMG